MALSDNLCNIHFDIVLFTGAPKCRNVTKCSRDELGTLKVSDNKPAFLTNLQEKATHQASANTERTMHTKIC